MKIIFIACVGLLVIAVNAHQAKNDEESEIAAVEESNDAVALGLEKTELAESETQLELPATRVKRGARRGARVRRIRKSLARRRLQRRRAHARRHAKNIRRAAAKRARHHRRAARVRRVRRRNRARRARVAARRAAARRAASPSQ
ncbi:hypothetical protein RB195_019596 [Necator americanus]|uniref:Uncharacterized protein n=1 Tax=Necator americanus TaxID=51031 RepID=A0ABR1CHH3_NECAM